MNRIALAAAVGCLLLAVPARAQSTGRILVMPFENVKRESRIVWLSEASAVLLADDLNALGGDAITREERLEAFERLQVPPAASLTDATVIRIAQIVGAAHVVVGTVQLEGDVLTVRARRIAVEAARIQGQASVQGPFPDLFATFERLARELAPFGATSPPAGERVNPPIGAFENYIKGVLTETPATAVSYLNKALEIDGTFDRARLALWRVYEDQGEHQRALTAVSRVPQSSSLSIRARFLAGLSQLRLKKYDDAFATYKALADERPAATVWNNLGVIQLRRSGTPQTGAPVYYFNRAAEANRAEPDYFFNLGYAYWLDRDSRAAVYWLREAVRRNPADGDAHYVLGSALSAVGNLAEAGREKELAKRLSSVYAEWERRPGTDVVPRGLERVKEGVELPYLRRIEDTLTQSGQRDQQELARFYLERGRRLFEQMSDREALGELSRALFLSPYEAEAHVLVARIHLRGGRALQAIDALKIALWSEETALAHALLAEAYLVTKDRGLARAEADRALTLDAESPEAKRVLSRLGPK